MLPEHYCSSPAKGPSFLRPGKSLAAVLEPSIETDTEKWQRERERERGIWRLLATQLAFQTENYRQVVGAPSAFGKSVKIRKRNRHIISTLITNGVKTRPQEQKQRQL